MSVETPAVEPTNPPAPAAPAPAPEAPAQETDWKAEARKWEERAKANKTAAERLAEIEEAKRVAEQSAAERAAELEAKVKEYETREQVAAWKAQVSQETGVPSTVLAGSTLEEIAAHAESLKSLIAPAPAMPRGPLVPTEGQKAGAATVAQLTQDDIKGMTPEQITAAKAEGRLNDLLRINI